MKSRSPRWKTEVKFLRPERIESAALALIAGFARQCSVTVAPPIPVDEIAESHQGLDLRFEDLQAETGDHRTLGAIRVRAKQLAVDLTLDPTIYRKREGRFRFTVAHEVGHWELHRQFVVPGSQSTFLGGVEGLDVICRSDASGDRGEWQANQFAAYLLMPKELVFEVWRNCRGSLDPYLAVDEIADLSAKWSLREDETPTVAIAREMAQIFKVSGQAMQIRLLELTLIRTRMPQASLPLS